MGVSWYRERIDAIVDGQTAGWTVADMRRLRERFIALRHAATLDETGPPLKRTVPGANVVELGPVSSSAAACNPPSPRSTTS